MKGWLLNMRNEADTRLVLHARDTTARGYSQVNALCRDTVVLLFAHREDLCQDTWIFFETSRRSFCIQVHRITLLDKKAQLVLHPTIGCDTMSHFYLLLLIIYLNSVTQMFKILFRYVEAKKV